MNALTGEILTLPKMSGSVSTPKSLSGNVGAKTINIGGKGDDGATFTPSVSADGIISWTNDRELPNPEPVNIKGAKGDKGDKGDRGLQGIQGIQGERGEQGVQGANGKDGYTPQKGTDYFTEADKKEIAEKAAELVEVPEGGGVTSWDDLTDKPDFAPIATSGSWNDLADKPFGVGKVEWKQIASHKDTKYINSETSVNVNDLTLSAELGHRYRIVFRDYGLNYTRIESTVIGTQATFITGQYISLGTVEDDIHAYQLMANMPWVFKFKNPISFPVGYDLFVYEAVENITTLDEKYLPESVVLESKLTAKGYQTEEQVTALINNALGVIENGTY